MTQEIVIRLHQTFEVDDLPHEATDVTDLFLELKRRTDDLTKLVATISAGMKVEETKEDREMLDALDLIEEARLRRKNKRIAKP